MRARIVCLALLTGVVGCDDTSPDTSAARDDDGGRKKKSSKRRCKTNEEAIILANQGDQIVDLDPHGAIEKYEQATKLAPTSHRILFKLAKAHRKTEKWSLVENTLARATDLAPTFANYWAMRGHALTQMAERRAISFKVAVDVYEKCTQADPNYAECFAGLGRAHAELGQHQEALQAWTRAVETAPNNTRYYAELGALYIRVGRFDDAKAVLSASVRPSKPGDPSGARCQMLLGDIALGQADPAAAEAYYRSAQSMDGSNMYAVFRLGYAHHLQKHADAATLLNKYMKRVCSGGSKQPRTCDAAAAIMIPR